MFFIPLSAINRNPFSLSLLFCFSTSTALDFFPYYRFSLPFSTSRSSAVNYKGLRPDGGIIRNNFQLKAFACTVSCLCKLMELRCMRHLASLLL